MEGKIQLGSTWKNVTRNQFITIVCVDVNEKVVSYTDNSDKSERPRIHDKSVEHILRLFEIVE
jgi:hypothetical protein